MIFFVDMSVISFDCPKNAIFFGAFEGVVLWVLWLWEERAQNKKKTAEAV